MSRLPPLQELPSQILTWLKENLMQPGACERHTHFNTYQSSHGIE